MKQVVIRMDDEQFDAVLAYAKDTRQTFAEAVRTLVEIAREEIRR